MSEKNDKKFVQDEKVTGGVRAKLFAGLGFLTLALGVVGIFVPLLPTTPFLLVSLFSFSRSTPAMADKILSNKYLAPYVEGYFSGKGLSVKQKFRTLALMWGVMIVSGIFFTDLWWVRISLLVIATLVTIHIVNMKSSRRDT